MSRRDPNLSAGVYVALTSAVMLVCLIGAFVVPTSLSLNRWLGLAPLAGLFLVVPVLQRFAHRSRIRDAVEELGGSVVCIRRLPFWRQDDPGWLLPIARRIKHEVEYVDAGGVAQHGLCRSGWFHGVEWLENSSGMRENLG